jgi:hypothetical protein
MNTFIHAPRLLAFVSARSVWEDLVELQTGYICQQTKQRLPEDSIVRAADKVAEFPVSAAVRHRHMLTFLN